MRLTRTCAPQGECGSRNAPLAGTDAGRIGNRIVLFAQWPLGELLPTATMSSELAEIIYAEIASKGAIPFRRYMELALYHERFGYYASGRAAIGRGGDFFTNVSVGPLFGRLIARQVCEMWHLLGSPAKFALVEQGAHGGDLAADILGGLMEFENPCFQAAEYAVVEPFRIMEERQRARLTAYAGKVRWARCIGDLPPAGGVHFSNELPDAFPVHVVTKYGELWREQMVVLRNGKLAFEAGPFCVDALRDACARIPLPLPDGYTTEINLEAEQWIRGIAGWMQRGFILAIDYGYSRAEYYSLARTSGTLSAYARHRREKNPLTHPGDIDLTTHIEFDSLIEAAIPSGLKVEGFTDQHHFVVALGLSHFAEGANAHERRSFQTLMHPQFLGTAFKVVAFSKGVGCEGLSGFRFARPSGNG